MGKPVDLEVFRGEKKEPCVYCGEAPHPTPLACPRIAVVYVSTEGYVEGIEFKEDWTPGVAG